MNVIQLDRARTRLRPRPGALPRIEPPGALTSPARHDPSHDLRHDPRQDPSHSARIADEAGEDRLRMRQNLAAFLVIVAIVGAGAWLIASLRYYSQIQACVEAGHHNCLPLDPKYQPSPYWR